MHTCVDPATATPRPRTQRPSSSHESWHCHPSGIGAVSFWLIQMPAFETGGVDALTIRETIVASWKVSVVSAPCLSETVTLGPACFA